jgi:hypothetical protein
MTVLPHSALNYTGDGIPKTKAAVRCPPQLDSNLRSPADDLKLLYQHKGIAGATPPPWGPGKANSSKTSFSFHSPSIDFASLSE